MMVGHNFERLKQHILPLSKATDWDAARREWELVGFEIQEDFDQCPCGQQIKERCHLKNQLNGNLTYVGNVCVHKFIGIDTQRIFDGLRRIIADISANANEDLIVHAYKFRYIYESEYKFLMDTRKARKISPAQMSWKKKANMRIINRTVVRKK